MAMANRKESRIPRDSYCSRPPPGGPAPRKGKVPQKKLKTKPTPLAQAIGNPLVDLGQVKALIPNSLDPIAMKAKAALQQPKPQSSVTHGGGGGTKEWYPTWEFDPDQPAVWNLLWNARMLTPIKRRFRPDPDYNGSGECPRPQHPGMHCPIMYNNVVSFEEAVAEARIKSLKKSANSQASRKGNPFKPTVRADWELDNWEPPQQGKVEATPPPTYKQDTPSPAFMAMKAANTSLLTPPPIPSGLSTEAEEAMASEYLDWEEDANHRMRWDPAFKQEQPSTSLSDMRNEHPYLQALWYYPITVAMGLEGGTTALSPSYRCREQGDEVHIIADIHPEVQYIHRLPSEEFFYLLETGVDGLLVQDMVDEFNLEDRAVEYLFQLSSELTNELMGCERNELLQLWSDERLAKINFNMHDPYHPAYNAPTVTQDEQRGWRAEFQKGYTRLALACSMKEHHRKAKESYAKTSTPWLNSPAPAVEAPTTPPKVDTQNKGECWQFLYDRRTERLLQQEECQYQLWLLETSHYNHQPTHDREITTTMDFHHRCQFFDSVDEYYNFISPPPKESKVKQVLKDVGRRLKAWMNEPLFEVGDEAMDVAPPPSPTPAEVVAASNQIARRVARDKTAHDEAYDLEWLESLGDQPNEPPANEAEKQQFVQRVMQEINSRTPEDVFSQDGIYLGQTIPFKKSEGGIVLLDPVTPPETG